MALTTLRNTIGASVSGTATKTEEMSTLTDVISETLDVTFALGTGANQANGFFHDERELADAASEELNFRAAGNLEDKLGEAIDFVKIKALVIKNTSDDAGLIIGGSVAQQMGLFSDVSDKQVIPPGGTYIFLAPDASGLDVSTNGTLKLEHDGIGVSSLLYKIMALGVQA